MSETPQRGVAKPRLQLLMRQAMDLTSMIDDDRAEIDAALHDVLFPLAEIRDMCYEAMKAHRALFDEQTQQRGQCHMRKLNTDVKYPFGSELFMTTKSGIMKFEFWEAKDYFAMVLEEMREVKADINRLRNAEHEYDMEAARTAAEKAVETDGEQI